MPTTEFNTLSNAEQLARLATACIPEEVSGPLVRDPVRSPALHRMLKAGQ